MVRGSRGPWAMMNMMIQGPLRWRTGARGILATWEFWFWTLQNFEAGCEDEIPKLSRSPPWALPTSPMSRHQLIIPPGQPSSQGGASWMPQMPDASACPVRGIHAASERQGGTFYSPAVGLRQDKDLGDLEVLWGSKKPSENWEALEYFCQNVCILIPKAPPPPPEWHRSGPRRQFCWKISYSPTSNVNCFTLVLKI